MESLTPPGTEIPGIESSGSSYGLDPIFYPRSIVVIDAVQDSDTAARLPWENIASGFQRGPVHRVKIDGDISAVVSEIPAKTDLAVIIASPDQQSDIAIVCDQRNIRGALLLAPDQREPALASDPFRHESICEKCVNGMRIIGPQAFGLISPHYNLNITTTPATPRVGSIAFLSQSGALCSAVLDWSFHTGVGFSAMASCGIAADVDWPDLITYFGDDPYTKSILVYVETIKDARAFLSACREVAFSKPIIALKGGRTEAGAAVAVSHSHGDDSADAVLSAALRRVGVLRVRSIAELFYMANILAKQPLPRGPRLTMVTNAIGPAILATDTLLASGGRLAEVSHETRQKLETVLPRQSCCNNPFDLMGDAGPERYSEVLSTLIQEKNSDGILAILTPQGKANPTETAKHVAQIARGIGKPVLASWMGGDQVAEGQKLLYEAGIPVFPYPDTPARLFALMWRQAQNLDSVYETPSVMVGEDVNPTDPTSASIILEGARAAGRTELSEWEAKAILRAYGIPVVETMPAATADEAATCAQIFGFPVILKLLSPLRQLKTTVQGVRVGLRTEKDVREAFCSIRDSLEAHNASAEFQGVTVQRMIPTKGFELVAGSRLDPRFGPYMYFGTGGQMTNILQDQALGLPPLTTTLAQRIIERTRVWNALGSTTENEKDRLSELQGLLVRLSQLIVQQPTIRELEINPLLASERTLVALNAHITLHPATTRFNDLPHPAIRPYPVQYTWQEAARNGQPLYIRPVRPEDEPLIVEFHKKLSEETIYRRYFFQHKLTRRTSHERLRRTCFLDFDREIALAAFFEDPTEGRVITAVGRLSRSRQENSAEIALVVADPYQSQGIGTLILKRLLDVGRAEKIRRVQGTMLPGNIHMQHLFSKLGFTIEPTSDDAVVAWLRL